MVGIYFSGTGNTKWCIEMLTSLIDDEAVVLSIEDSEVVQMIKKHQKIIFGYPIQFSNLPMIVRYFINQNASIWTGKEVLCVTTQGAFSGDGAGCAARLLKKHGAKILGGFHLKMPDSVSDVKLLKKSHAKNQKTIIKAQDKIIQSAQRINKGIYPQKGLRFYSRWLGLFGQRLWFLNVSKKYSNKLKVNSNCVGCGLCAKNCPMKNLMIDSNKAIALDQCTMCYRCISSCPQKAITLIGKKVYEQCRFDRYY